MVRAGLEDAPAGMEMQRKRCQPGLGAKEGQAGWTERRGAVDQAKGESERSWHREKAWACWPLRSAVAGPQRMGEKGPILCRAV